MISGTLNMHFGIFPDDWRQIMKKNENPAADCFKKYMLSKGCIASGDFKLNADEQKSIPVQKIYSHMEAIKEFHDMACGYSESSGPKLKSSAGRLIENYKISLKKVRKQILKLQRQKDLNDFEIYFLKNADVMIKRGEKAVSKADNSRYMSLILRSMKNNEICIGNTGFDNLRKEDTLKIVSFDSCSYDMVEIDGISFLRKLKKKRIDGDFKKMITDYCDIERLGSESTDFMTAVLSYPYEFMKMSVRCIENKRDLDVPYRLRKLKKAVKVDEEGGN